MDVATLKALADENRLALVELLAGGERCVCELSAATGLSVALVSHHVKRLRLAGLVTTRKEGQWLHCRLVPERFSALGADLTRLADSATLAAASASACSPACHTTKERSA